MFGHPGPGWRRSAVGCSLNAPRDEPRDEIAERQRHRAAGEEVEAGGHGSFSKYRMSDTWRADIDIARNSPLKTSYQPSP